MNDLAEKVSVVTGAARNIGYAIALRLARGGSTVVLADIDAAAGERSAQAIRDCGHLAIHHTIDVANPTQVSAAIADIAYRYGRIDILVNNAGLIDRSPFLDVSHEFWNRIISVNLTGTFNCSQAVAREMVRRRTGGRIVNIASISGQQGGLGRAAYGASKAAIINLTATMALELAEYGIVVNAIAPGPIREISPDLSTERAKATMARLSQKRYGTPTDIAAAVAFLVSEECSFTAGHVLNVDGGFQTTGVTYDPLPSRWLMEVSK